jgi:predicted lipoprotein with Yx(FWY)xxD motif
MKSTHEGIHKRPSRSAGHRPSGTPALVRLGWSIAALAALAFIAAACSGGGSSSSGAGSYGAAPTASSGSPSAAIVNLGGSKLGQTLVDGQGRTLYLFEADKAGKSECNGACTSAWPPYVTSSAPHPGTGVTGALLATSVRGDGTTQVTYNHRPLYFYSGDTGAGQQNGEGLNAFGALWYVVAPSGGPVTGASS